VTAIEVGGQVRRIDRARRGQGGGHGREGRRSGWQAWT
jgi:hypothetical protein